MDLSVLTPTELAQYNEDIKKGIQVGTLFTYSNGYNSQSGTFVVTGFYLSKASVSHYGTKTPAALYVHAKRVVDVDGQRIKNSKVIRSVEVRLIYPERIVTEDAVNRNYESEMKRAHSDLACSIRHAEEKRKQLLALLAK